MTLLWSFRLRKRLSVRNFKHVERCFCTCIKRVFWMHESTRNRYVYVLADVGTPVPDIMRTSNPVPDIDPYLRITDSWSTERVRHIKVQETKVSRSRQRGNISYETMRLNGTILELVRRFSYLGVLSTPSFTQHLESKLMTAPMSLIGCLIYIDMKLVMNLFLITVAPLATHGLRARAPLLSLGNLRQLDSFEATSVGRSSNFQATVDRP